MARTEIDQICTGVLALLENYKREKEKVEKVEMFLADMITSPSRFPGINCPIGDTSMYILRASLIHYYALKIYVELESLYTYILREFDPNCKISLMNIKMNSFIRVLLSNSTEGDKISKTDRKALVEGIQNSSEFDNSITPVYSIIHTFIEWRGKNAHHVIGIHNINLDDARVNFEIQKENMVNLYDKLLRYITELKNPGFSTKFDDFI